MSLFLKYLFELILVLILQIRGVVIVAYVLGRKLARCGSISDNEEHFLDLARFPFKCDLGKFIPRAARKIGNKLSVSAAILRLWFNTK